MNPNENFIDRDIAELSREYSLIHGSNINLARITPQLIDGLKMVAKRLLYIMYLRDQSNRYRKVAAITGEVIATVHHHGQCLRGNTEFVAMALEDDQQDCRYRAPSRMTIENLYVKGTPVRVVAYDSKTNAAVHAIAKDFRISKYVDELYRIVFTSGAMIECTGNHPFLVDTVDFGNPIEKGPIYDSHIEFPTTTKWVAAENLIPGCEFHREASTAEVPDSVTWVRESPDLLPTPVVKLNDEDRAIVMAVYRVKLDKLEPVYDFTVEGCENAMIYVGSLDPTIADNDIRYNVATSHYVFAHNSSVYSTLVNLAQGWNNNLPLIDGYGNFGCHDDQTEVLTRSGWQLFKDATKADLFATVDPVTGRMIFEHPTNVMAYPYTGEMIRGSHKALDFKVTPNHRMLVSKYDRHHRRFGDYTFTEADQLGEYSKLRSEFHHDGNKPDCVILDAEIISNGNVLQEKIIPMTAWVQFLGMYLADGTMGNPHHESNYSEYFTIVAMNKQCEISYYSDVLEAMGFGTKWKPFNRGFQLWDKRVWKLLESYGLRGTHAKQKFVPDFIFDLDESLIKLFLYGFAMGDGSFTDIDALCYHTSSKQMAEQLQVLTMMGGKLSTIDTMAPKTTTIRGKEITGSEQYSVYQWEGKSQSIDRDIHLSREAYDGIVYCAEVPTYHTLITRRNGKILLSGNSVAGDVAGADRYILARLSAYARACFFEDWKESAVDMVLGADEMTMEPVYLPAKYPNALLNGLLGIGYGMSSNVPPFCFSEVVNVTMALMQNPDAKFLLIPDSPTGCDIVAGNFPKICETGTGVYTMRCKYKIEPGSNQITIVALPYLVTVKTIREKISEIKEAGGLVELDDMNDYSGKTVDLRLIIRQDISPYKFMKKLIGMIPGLERSYPVNITVTDDLTAYDLSVRKLLLEWIQYRREQKRVVINHKRTRILGDQRTVDVKIFILAGTRLEDTISLFRGSIDRDDIERRLIEKYHNSEIRMDSLQAKALANMRLHEICEKTRLECLADREALTKELAEVDAILAAENGIDQVIIGELKDGVKRFGAARRSNVIPYKISIETEIPGESILHLSPDGVVLRRAASNAEEEPLPKEPGSFAVKVENDSAFVAIDEDGLFSFINVKELPVDNEVPLNRFIKQKLGKIAALIPFDIDSDRFCTLISANGILKRFSVSEMKPSKRPCIDLDKNDKLVKGIVSKPGTHRDILIFTRDGFGQRLDPNLIRVTSYNAKGTQGFKLTGDDVIIGCYLIDPRNQYLLYITTRGKARLNLTEYLPLRDNRNATMVRLIQLPDRDQLLNVIGCDKFDKLRLYYQDLSEETVKVKDIPEGTMSSSPVKIVNTSMVSNRLVKVSML